jgi:hypothetical protein
MKAFSAILIGLVSAKDTVIVKENAAQLSHKRPEVQAYDCKKCLVEEEDTLLCTTYGTSVKVGWEWSQEWYDDPTTLNYKDGWYQLGLEFYSQQGGGTSVLFDVEKFYYNDFQVTVDTFKAKTRLETKYYYTSHRTCVYGYYFYEDFLAQVEMAMSFPECYKDFIYCLWSLDNWTSKWALWLDECDMSSAEDIDIYKKDFDATTSTKYFIGDGLDSANCTPGYLFNSPFASFLGSVQDNLVAYIQTSLESRGHRGFE